MIFPGVGGHVGTFSGNLLIDLETNLNIVVIFRVALKAYEKLGPILPSEFPNQAPRELLDGPFWAHV